MKRHLRTHTASGLYANVRLGSPRFSDCRGVGICAILLDDQPAIHPACRDWCRAWLEVDRPTGRLLLAFDRSTISERTFDHHFGRGLLDVQETYTLPEAVVRHFNLSGDSHKLRAGRYPIRDFPDLPDLVPAKPVGVSIPSGCMPRGIGFPRYMLYAAIEIENYHDTVNERVPY